MSDDGWIENRGRRPRDENQMRYLRFRNGAETTEPRKVGGYRWTLNDPKFGGASGSDFDITHSRRA